MISVHPQMLAQLQERAARCTELEKLAAEVVAELRDKTREVGRRLVADYPASEYHTGEAYAYDAAADLVAEKLGVKS